METIVVPKIFVYISNILTICYIIQGIVWIIKKIKHKRELEFNAAMNRMTHHKIDNSVEYPTFVNAVYDIPYEDAVKVFMIYEKYKKQYIKKTKILLKTK